MNGAAQTLIGSALTDIRDVGVDIGIAKLAGPLHPDHRKSIVTAGTSQKCQVGDTGRFMI